MPQALVQAVLLSCLPAVPACTHTLHRPDGTGGGESDSVDGLANDGGTGGVRAAGGTFGASGGTGGNIGTGGDPFGGFGGSGGTGGLGFGGCTPPEVYDLGLQDDYVSSYAAPAPTFYAWISDEEDADLRAGGSPLSAEETERTFSVQQLAAWVLGHPDGLEAAVLPAFEQSRSAWPRAWPIAFSSSGERTGTRLLRLELASDAWIARVAPHGTIWEVYDLDGYTRSLEEARETPERIAVLQFTHLGERGNADCGSREQVVTGTAYREFIIGNAALLSSYEVGTEAVLAELSSNITDLSEYMTRTRPCPPRVPEPFEAFMACNWGNVGEPFLDALANPGEIYRPTAMHLADLIESLEDSLFEPDPFVVE